MIPVVSDGSLFQLEINPFYVSEPVVYGVSYWRLILKYIQFDLMRVQAITPAIVDPGHWATMSYFSYVCFIQFKFGIYHL